MAEPATFTVRVPADLKRRLDQLAKAADRSRSWPATEALRHYVEDQQWQLAQIEQGIRDAEAVRVVPHKEVNRWLKSWGRKQKLRPPTCKWSGRGRLSGPWPTPKPTWADKRAAMLRHEMGSVNTRDIRLRRIAAVVLAAGAISAALFGVAGARAQSLPGQIVVQGPAGSASILIAAMENGHPVTDLRKEDLKLWIGRQEQTISRLTYSQPVHLSIGLLFDMSGSRRAEWQGLDIVDAPDFFRRVLKKGDQAFVMHFNDVIYLDTDPTSNLTLLNKALQRVAAERPAGGTALYDAIMAGCRQLQSRDGAYRMLVIVTDGEDNSSRYTRRQALDAAQRTGTALCFFNVAQTMKPGLFRVTTNSVGHADGVMSDAARATGGMFFEISRRTGMASAFDSVAEILRAPYVLDFEPGTGSRNPLRIKIRCMRRDVKIAAPDEF